MKLVTPILVVILWEFILAVGKTYIFRSYQNRWAAGILGYTLCAFIFGVVKSNTSGYYRNRRAARKIGLPYVSVPFLDFNMLYGIFARTPIFAPLVDRILPSFLTGWARYARPDWRFIHKYRVHEELGDLFQVVTPEVIVLNIADAGVIRDILSRRNDFVKVSRVAPTKLYGGNVLLAEGPEWRRHRKIVSPPFTERNNHLVWKEAIRQATAMLQFWATPAAVEETPSIITSIKTLTINVISHAGFGVSLPYGDPSESSEQQNGQESKLISATKPGPGHSMTYKQAVELLTTDFRKTMFSQMIPGWMMKRMPPALQEVGKAYHEFGNYLRELLKGEAENPSEKENLLSALNRSERTERELDGKGLSESEMVGNVFLFAVAGHETTSVTLEFIILNLALHPDKQEWLHRKIDEHLNRMPEDPREWDYELFRKLTGPICVMYETLRMYPPTPVILRTTDLKPQTVNYNDKTYVLPENFVIACNFIGLHYNTKYWGEDATQFRPERWEYRGPEKDTADTDADAPTRFPGVKEPARGTFLPFSEGFRGCLGRRFAEVEIAAVIATLFRKHKVALKLEAGETREDAAARVQLALDKSSNQFTLAVRKDIGVTWTERN